MNQRFRRQHPIAIYILDFYCDHIKLSIEIDGHNHNVSDQHEYDLNRTEFLNSIGITEIRFTNDEVMSNIELVIEKIKNVIDRIIVP